MIALIAKDVRILGPFLWVVLPVYLATSVGASREGPALFALSLALALALIVLPPGVEWRFGTDGLVASLPVSRHTVVLARYVWALLAIACSLALWQLMIFVLSAVFDQADRHLRLWISLNGLLAFSSLAILLAALFLPCYFRWGIGTGGAVFSVGLVALSALAAGARWLALNALGGGPDLSSVDLEAMRTLARLAWMAVVALGTAASVALSMGFHRQREF